MLNITINKNGNPYNTFILTVHTQINTRTQINANVYQKQPPEAAKKTKKPGTRGHRITPTASNRPKTLNLE